MQILKDAILGGNTRLLIAKIIIHFFLAFIAMGQSDREDDGLGIKPVSLQINKLKLLSF